MPDIITYSLKKLANFLLDKNFKVKEFKCKDGSDKVLISSALVALLQRLRDHYKKPITINSAYRTATYNKKVGGAKDSQHLYGTAADITIKGVTPREIAELLEKWGAGGIGLYDYGKGAGFVHVDVRDKKSRWIQTSKNGSAKTVTGFLGTHETLKKGSKGIEVTKLQATLDTRGYKCGKADGKFGTNTEKAVKAFQRAHELYQDGIAGQKTLSKLYSL